MRTFGWSPSDLELQVKNMNMFLKIQKYLNAKIQKQMNTKMALLTRSCTWRINNYAPANLSPSDLTGREKTPIFNFDSFVVFQELIGEIDQDGNGSISFNEFVWLMTRWVVIGFSTKLIQIGRYSLCLGGEVSGSNRSKLEDRSCSILICFLGRSRIQRSKTRSGRRFGFSTRRGMASFALQVSTHPRFVGRVNQKHVLNFG